MKPRFTRDPKGDEAMEEIVRLLETGSARDREEFVQYIRNHENYSKVLWFAGETRGMIKRLPHSGSKDQFLSILTLMDKPPERMTAREMVWLANWLSGPAYLMDEDGLVGEIR